MLQQNVALEPCNSTHCLTRGLELQLLNTWQRETECRTVGDGCAVLPKNPTECSRSLDDRYMQAAARADGPRWTCQSWSRNALFIS